MIWDHNIGHLTLTLGSFLVTNVTTPTWTPKVANMMAFQGSFWSFWAIALRSFGDLGKHASRISLRPERSLTVAGNTVLLEPPSHSP